MKKNLPEEIEYSDEVPPRLLQTDQNDEESKETPKKSKKKFKKKVSETESSEKKDKKTKKRRMKTEIETSSSTAAKKLTLETEQIANENNENENENEYIQKFAKTEENNLDDYGESQKRHKKESKKKIERPKNGKKLTSSVKKSNFENEDSEPQNNGNEDLENSPEKIVPKEELESSKKN